MSVIIDSPISPLRMALATVDQAAGVREAVISASGRVLARLDCVADNRPLRTYYEDSGYRLVAYKSFPRIEGAPETALYEKVLPDS